MKQIIDMTGDELDAHLDGWYAAAANAGDTATLDLLDRVVAGEGPEPLQQLQALDDAYAARLDTE